EKEMFLQTTLTRGRVWPLALLVPALFVSSCGESGRRPAYPVHGRVLFEGAPIANAQVVLHPLAEDKAHPVRPTGRAAPDGSLTLTTYTAGDGAPEGEYAVTVELRRRPPDSE